MSEFETIADLFAPGRHPTRPLEPIQKVDQTDQIEQDIEEYHETPSAERVLMAIADIIENSGQPHRFRYVHATFGSGKSHLLKLTGVATGEMEGLEEYADKLANETSGFKAIRDALVNSHIDHLLPLFMNLLDRDRADAELPMLLFEELGRRRGYETSRTWLLEFCWRLEVVHGLWDELAEHTYGDLSLSDVVDRPSSLRPWLKAAIPRLDGANDVGLDTAAAVKEEIEAATKNVTDDVFGPNDIVDRLARTKQFLQQDGDTYEFLIGLDEIAIYVGTQPNRYEEVVETITALIEGLNPPIIGTGQWRMRDMQRNFIGEVDEEAWYTEEIELNGADTETIVRKRWLQKSTTGDEWIDTEVLSEAPEIEPTVIEDAEVSIHEDPVESYPFRDHDLWLLRKVMQGLIEGDKETDREYIQGRALLVRVRSLFDKHGWAELPPGKIVSWDVLYDVIATDTTLIEEWAQNLIDRVDNTFDDALAVRTAKALFLLSQVEEVPRTAENLARLMVDDVRVDVAALQADVETQLQVLAEANLIREDVEASPTTYTILSEADIRFWQEVQKEATDLPAHQLRSNIQQDFQEVESTRLTAPDGVNSGTFGELKDVSYTVRYSITQSVPEAPNDRYDAIVIRLLATDKDTLTKERKVWQKANSGPGGTEDVLIAVELTDAIRERYRQLIAMRSVLGGMANPEPELQIQQQVEEEKLQENLKTRLNDGSVYTPSHEAAFGSYLKHLDAAVTAAVMDKFPNRRSIEPSIQIEDLKALTEFFHDGGQWPPTWEKADAKVLGVNIVPRTIDDGWVTEFEEQFPDDNRISGERILETFEGRRGAFLGSPLKALHAILFVLVATNRVEVRVSGERLTDTTEIARTIIRRTKLEKAVFDFDPEPPTEGLTEVYEALVGSTPETDDTAELLVGLSSWVNENALTIRSVVTKSNMAFGSRGNLKDLKKALEPAMSGDELDADRLTNPTVAEQATLYEQVAPLFTSESDTKSLWDRFQAASTNAAALYEDAPEVTQMQAYATGKAIPDVETIETQIKNAHELRTRRLQELVYKLSGTPTQTDDRRALCTELTTLVGSKTFEEMLKSIKETLPAVDFDTLHSLNERAASTTESLAEEVFAQSDVTSEAAQLEAARSLLETNDGSLYESLTALHESLTESQPNAFITGQIERVLSGMEIPTPKELDDCSHKARPFWAVKTS
ncbi:hypothetical protein ACFQH3_20340 [Haladaptatus sp. GCM10025707]|uniref:hypothetical protein n=1 Tax=Haladaptatus sp. GCM10025707 TaxID=3252658 RepID=UPI00360DFBB5